jgi:hypothetical protein
MCPDGTYNNIDGSTDITDCKICPPGYYCPNTAGVAKITQCPPGNYCLEGTGVS